jgi:hypothetical protein
MNILKGLEFLFRLAGLENRMDIGERALGHADA